jgi:hypothetical protein
MQLWPTFLETAHHAAPSCHFIYCLKISSSLAMMQVTVFATNIMLWHAHICLSLFHVTHLLTFIAPMHMHNSHCIRAVSPSQWIHSLYTDKTMSLIATFFHSTLQKHQWGGTCTKLVFKQKGNYLITHITVHVQMHTALTCATELYALFCMTIITLYLLIFSIFTYKHRDWWLAQKVWAATKAS